MIYVYDTWGAGGGSFPWEGSYAGLELWGVTVFTPAGGASAPLSSSVLLFGNGLAGVLIYRRRQRS